MCRTQVEYVDELADDVERHGEEIPVWLRNAPAVEPEHAPDEYRRLWDGFTATGEEGV